MTRKTGKPVGRPAIGPRFAVRFDPPVLALLREEAERTGVTASEIVRAAVEEKLERNAITAEALA